MAKLSAMELANKLQAMYKTKKKDCGISTGTDIKMPTMYVPAPAPIQKLLGLPGYPVGRVVEIAGKSNSGKSTLASLAMVEAQKEGFYVVFVETEGKFSTTRFEKLGGKPEEILYVKGSTLEIGFTGLDDALKVIYSSDSEAKVLIVWDSIGGCPSNAEAEIQADETMQLAVAAKVIKRNLRVLVPKWVDNPNYNIAAIFINTLYDNIGSVGKTNSGGAGLEYSCSIIMQMGRISNIDKVVKGEKVRVGIETKVQVTKNHLQSGELTLKDVIMSVFAYNVDFKAVKAKSEEEEG